jgi:hypothetical protein
MAETYHIRLFNDRVRTMNQTRGKSLMLTPQEAQSLHGDIFELLTQIAELSKQIEAKSEVVEVSLDGGGFR